MAKTQQELLDATTQLVGIKSTANSAKGRKEALNFMIDVLKNSGKDITIERFVKRESESVLVYKAKQRPHNFRLMLNAHLDVVPGKPEQYQAVVKDGKLYGRGVYDMKAAAIIFADVFCEYVDKVPYALGLQFVTDEESGGNKGTAHQIAQGVRADFVVCGECGRAPNVYELANEAKGIVIMNIEFTGTPAHGAYLWRGENAILQATAFTQALLQRYPVPSGEHSGTTVNVSSIGTKNKALTAVPDHATVRLEIRFTSDDPNFRSKRHAAALIEEIDPSARISDMNIFDAPLYSSPQNPLLQQLKAAAESIEGHKFTLVRRHATSDGRHYGNVGDQACEFGIAGENQHGDGENITLKAFGDYRDTMHSFLEGTIEAEKYNTGTTAYTDV